MHVTNLRVASDQSAIHVQWQSGKPSVRKVNSALTSATNEQRCRGPNQQPGMCSPVFSLANSAASHGGHYRAYALSVSDYSKQMTFRVRAITLLTQYQQNQIRMILIL